MILLSFRFNKFSRGQSYWKFNNSLLRDIQYIIEIKSVIGSVKQQYASEEQNPNLPVNDISNDKLILDDIQREKQWSKNGALGDTRQNGTQIWFYSIYYNMLLPDTEKWIYSFQFFHQYHNHTACI